jgi:hypothetical protein
MAVKKVKSAAERRENRKVIYARGYPYGAPLLLIRGGATKHPEIVDFLKGNDFVYEGRPTYAWKTYAGLIATREILTILQDEYDCTILAKKTMDENYILAGFETRQA